MTAGSAAAASAAPQAKGVTVSPAFQQVSISPDQPQKQVTFKITNNETKPQTFSLTSQDFSTLNESGGLFFVGANPSQLQKKYGLARWLSLPQTSLTLQPKQTVTLLADIQNLPDMSPGGHYGALMLSAGGGQTTGPNNVSIHPIASSLLFVTKLGGDTHRLGLYGVTMQRSWFSLPAAVTLRVRNDGNSHVTPRGLVTLTDAKGKIVSKGVINENSNLVLPETYRQLYVPLERTATAAAIGEYKLRVDYRIDGISQYRSYQKGIFYMPLGWLWVILIIIVIAAATYKFRARIPRNKSNK